MGIQNPEWLNQNSTRNYPIKEDQSRGPVGFEIPNNFIVDMQLVGVERNLNYFISEVAVVGTTINLLVADTLGTTVITFLIDSPTHVKYKTYTASGLGEIFGKLVIDNVGSLLALIPSGSGVTFAEAETTLEISALVPTDKDFRVTSLGKLGDGITYTGDVKLEQGDGILIDNNVPENALVISLAPEPDPIPSACECPPNFPSVKTINGIPPDCNGNFCIDAGGINVLDTDGSCLVIDSLLDPVEICDLGVGIPGAPGDPGAPGPPGPPGEDAVCKCKVCVLIKSPEGVIVEEVPDGAVVTGVSVTNIDEENCDVVVIMCTEYLKDLIINSIPTCDEIET